MGWGRMSSIRHSSGAKLRSTKPWRSSNASDFKVKCYYQHNPDVLASGFGLGPSGGSSPPIPNLFVLPLEAPDQTESAWSSRWACNVKRSQRNSNTYSARDRAGSPALVKPQVQQSGKRSLTGPAHQGPAEHRSVAYPLKARNSGSSRSARSCLSADSRVARWPWPLPGNSQRSSMVEQA